MPPIELVEPPSQSEFLRLLVAMHELTDRSGVADQVNRQPARPLRRCHIFDPLQRPIQDSFVKDQHAVEGLILGQRRHVPLDGQMREKLADSRFAHPHQVPLAVDLEKFLGPEQIGILGVNAVMGLRVWPLIRSSNSDIIPAVSWVGLFQDQPIASPDNFG